MCPPSRTTPEISCLTFIDYRIEDTPKYTIEECKERDATYAAPLRVRARLLNKETGEIKEQRGLYGRFPAHDRLAAPLSSTAPSASLSLSSFVPRASISTWLMTRPARSCSARTVIPNRGAWLEYETDSQRHLLCPHRQKPQAAP